jgi:GAF domain-containing protein
MMWVAKVLAQTGTVGEVGSMSISIYEPATRLLNEPVREKAVEASGVLTQHDDLVLTTIVAQARSKAGTQKAALPIVYRDWQYIIAAVGLPVGVVSRRTSFCGHAIAGSELFFSVLDASNDSRFAGNPLVLDGDVRSYFGALVFGENKNLPLGTLCAFDPEPRRSVPPALANELIALAQQVRQHLIATAVPSKEVTMLSRSASCQMTSADQHGKRALAHSGSAF